LVVVVVVVAVGGGDGGARFPTGIVFAGVVCGCVGAVAVEILADAGARRPLIMYRVCWVIVAVVLPSSYRTRG